jgi:hypothetical protein
MLSEILVQKSLMSHKLSRCIVSMALILVIEATGVAFPPSNPYRPTAADIQGMIDRTGDFSGNSQASTFQTMNTPEGVLINATWNTGAPLVNETFTRIVTAQRFPDDNGDGNGGDLDAFDGVVWSILSETAIAVKPYSQDWDNFNFQEGGQPSTGCGIGVICVPANTRTLVSIDWNMVTGTFGPAARTNVFELGLQIFGPSLPQDGSAIKSAIRITTAIPEPASIALAGLGGVAVVAAFRNWHRK